MTTLTPSTIYAEAVRLLPPQDIDHHASDLYIRVTPGGCSCTIQKGEAQMTEYTSF